MRSLNHDVDTFCDKSLLHPDEEPYRLVPRCLVRIYFQILEVFPESPFFRLTIPRLTTARHSNAMQILVIL